MRRLVICMFRISRQTSRGLRDAHVVALLFRRLSPKEREREKKNQSANLICIPTATTEKKTIDNRDRGPFLDRPKESSI